MAIMRMDDNFDLDKYDPYKDTLVTTVRGTEEEFREVLDKLMGGKTNMPEYKTRSLIKKNDVIKAIGEEVLNVTLNMPWSVASKEMARNTLYALKQTVQVMPEIETSGWISVKERMPEEKQHSCNGVKGAPHSKLYLVVVRDPFGESTSVQTDMTINGKWYNYGCDVTHWMPLPDAPEVEDE